MGLITGTNLSDTLTDEPGNARIAPAITPGAKAAPAALPPPGGLSYDDTVNALDGDDFITVNRGDDTVNGGNGRDIVYDKGSGNDTFNGGAENDTFHVGLGNDTFNGGAGIDTVSYAGRDVLVSLDLADGHALAEGIDTLVSVENVVGSRYDDFLVGDFAANRFDGGEGSDELDGDYGNDHLAGNDGNDTLTGARGRDLLFGGGGDDTLYGASEGQPDEGRPGDTNNRDTLDGGDGDDVMDGGDGDDLLRGGDDNDTMMGGDDNDRLAGHDGHDIMTGGEGIDTFIYLTRGETWDADRITDFEQGVDKIDVSAIDARSDIAGKQSYRFDASQDDTIEEGVDWLNDDWSGTTMPGPHINGDPGEIEIRGHSGDTYVYIPHGDGKVGMTIILDGIHNLTSSDFIF